MRTIDSFDGDNRFLSNFWPVEIVHKGHRYATSEHAYQAAKAQTEEAERRSNTLEAPATLNV